MVSGTTDDQPLNHSLQAFLSVLEDRQKECRLYMDTVGDILRQHIPNMGMYLVPLLFCQVASLSYTVDRNTVSMKEPLSNSCKLCGRRIQSSMLTST